MTKDEAWYRACLEIIDRCVAPDMYGNARAMLDKAMAAAKGAKTTVDYDPQKVIDAAYQRLSRK